MSTIAGLDSPLGVKDMQAGHPHLSGPSEISPIESELETILVVGSAAFRSKTKDGNGVGD